MVPAGVRAIVEIGGGDGAEPIALPLPVGTPTAYGRVPRKVRAVVATPTVDLTGERRALAQARQAVADKLTGLSSVAVAGADAFADEYISAVVAGAVEKYQQELVVFGRIDDEHPWRVGLYGIDAGGEQLVIDGGPRSPRGSTRPASTSRGGWSAGSATSAASTTS